MLFFCLFVFSQFWKPCWCGTFFFPKTCALKTHTVCGGGGETETEILRQTDRQRYTERQRQKEKKSMRSYFQYSKTAPKIIVTECSGAVIPVYNRESHRGKTEPPCPFPLTRKGELCVLWVRVYVTYCSAFSCSRTIGQSGIGCILTTAYVFILNMPVSLSLWEGIERTVFTKSVINPRAFPWICSLARIWDGF